MAKIETDTVNNTSIIAFGTEFVGEIKSNGSVRIAGKLKGNISLTERLVIDKSGVVEGEISCKVANISGKVDGKLSCAELLELKDTASVHGDIDTTKIIIEEGAIFTGTCQMDTKDAAVNSIKK